MNAKNQTVKQPRCPSCGEGILKPKTLHECFNHEEDGRTMPVVVQNVPVEICTRCGEKFHGPEAARLHHQAICKTFGFLTPEQIRSVREDNGLTQEEFARLTGIGQATISRWERGRLVQNRAMDNYLRLLKANRANVRLLKNLQGITKELGDGSQQQHRYLD